MNQTEISSQLIGLNSKISNAQSGLLKSKFSEKSSFSNNSNSSFPEKSQSESASKLNCIFHICYNGEPRQFALYGQLLSKDEELDPVPPLD